MTYSISSTNTFLDCPRKYEHRYIDRMVAIQEGERALVGKAVHEGLRAVKDGDKNYIGAVRSELQYVKKIPAMFAELMTTAWAIRYKDDGLEYILNEKEWEYEYKGIKFQGIFDGIAKKPNGELVLVEHKTTISDIGPSSHYWSRLDINLQIEVYARVAEALGYPISGIIYDVIRIPELKPKKATPKEKLQYYVKGSRDGKYGPGDLKPGQRLEPEGWAEFKGRCNTYIIDNLNSLLVREILPPDRAAWQRSLDDAWETAKLSQQGFFPKNANSCWKGPRYLCEYHPVCTGAAELSNPSLYQIRSRR